MTSREARHQRLLEYLTGRGWTPIAELVPWFEQVAKVARHTAGADLNFLCSVGKLEKRSTRPEGAFAFPAYEYHLIGDPIPAVRPAPLFPPSTPSAPGAHASNRPSELQRARIRAAVDAEPDRLWTIAELARVAGCSSATARARVASLVEEGFLEDAAESGLRRLRRFRAEDCAPDPVSAEDAP